MSVQTELSTGNALEHTYRPALKILFETLEPSIHAANEPKRSEHGAPDFIFQDTQNKNFIRGYAETKDLNVDLDKVEKSEQMKRYLEYHNIILTNYLEFRFFQNGEKYQTVTIASLEHGGIHQIEENFEQFEGEMIQFLQGVPAPIKSAEKLAKIMGGHARRIRKNVIHYLSEGDVNKNASLSQIFTAMQTLLVHDLSVSAFADMYAQTLVYGLFIARYYDKTPDNFTRAEARDLVPASNPFLHKFFDHITGTDFDFRLAYITDELCDVFGVSNIYALMHQKSDLWGEKVGKDPIIHFYEDFLFEYDPELKKQMGAYYTPIPVVKFIIRSVDDVLKTEFSLRDGLADTTRIAHLKQVQNSKVKIQIPKVQILDPAVGTATFLNEIINHIYAKFENQSGAWPSYVETELLPRLHGFELMMSPYMIAHLKLALTLKETGINDFKQRIGVYLTNTLEEGSKSNPGLFDSLGVVGAMTQESAQASLIKTSAPIMVVIGNPPYSGESFNKGPHAMKLVDKYKFEPGTKDRLNERNPKWINDDYVKFIAFATDLIDKTGEGIVAMITNHGYLDNPTFRGMRWSLINTFSGLYLLDLHGNAKKKEVSPDGSPDKNVFDIQQGVSIMIGVKGKSAKPKLATVYRSDLYGTRSAKFDWLNNNSLKSIKWDKISLHSPSYFFVNKDESVQNEYETGVKINELFPLNNVGVVTSRDAFVIDSSREALYSRISSFYMMNPDDPKLKDIVKQSDKFQYKKAIEMGFDERNIYPIAYRPFDNRFIYYSDYYIERSRKDVMKHMMHSNNLALLIKRQCKQDFSYVFVTDRLTESCMFESAYANNTVCPLYLYDSMGKVPNLNEKLVALLLSKVEDKVKVIPEDIFDYVYATLHSRSYRSKYKDFLRSDFPRIPPARDTKSFWSLVKLGGQLRKLHLLDPSELGELKTTFPVAGASAIEKIEYKDNKVYINSTQYFDGVKQKVFDFYIGGYQPAQKWLKDRKGSTLTYQDILHYEKILASQAKTIEVMSIIDNSPNI